jgi:hypothetical protein
MGTTRQIAPDEWKNYFDRFTRQYLGGDATEAATIEIVSPTLGDQFEITAARLLGFGYDPRAKVFEVSLDGMDHLVFKPDQIWVIEGEAGFVSALELLLGDGSREIIYVRRSGPLATVGAAP